MLIARRALLVGVLASGPTFPAKAIDLPDENALVADAWAAVSRAFVDDKYAGVDWAAVRSDYVRRRYKSMSEARAAITEMLALLGDRYTRYVNPSQYEALSARFKATDVGGIGVTLKMSSAGTVQVAALEAHSPAEKAGIRIGDVLLKAGNVRADSRNLDDIAAELLGPLNTSVGIAVKRSEEVIDMPIMRASLGAREARVSLASLRNSNVATITVRQFSADVTAPAIATSLDSPIVKRADIIVLDLRANPGGDFSSAVQAAKLFLPTDVNIVRTLRRPDPSGKAVGRGGGEVVIRTDADGIFSRDPRPLFLLIDSNTASAAEVFAAALIDNERAEALGERSFGKGLVQSLIRLTDGGAIVCTVARYTTPLGIDINGRGIPADGKGGSCSWSAGATTEACLTSIL